MTSTEKKKSRMNIIRRAVDNQWYNMCVVRNLLVIVSGGFVIPLFLFMIHQTSTYT